MPSSQSDSPETPAARFTLTTPHALMAAACCIALVVFVQITNGAYQSERGQFSDEAAHFLNGLLLRDYVYTGLGSSPLAFAEAYYFHYPKIAPLMWPPFFHGVLGVFLLPGWAPGPAAIALLGLFAAWAGWRLYTIVMSFAPLPVAVGAVAFFLLTPLVIALSGAVMVDMVVATLALEATYWLAQFARTGLMRHAIVFGLVAAAGCLSKGNGVAIVLIPLFLILVAGRWDLLRRAGLYVSALLVVVLAVPLLAYTYRLDAALGDFGPLSMGLVAERLRFYSMHVVTELGALAGVLAVVGSVVAIGAYRTQRSAAGLEASALVALVLAAFAFHALSPHILSAERYITLAFAPIYGLVGLGAVTITRPLTSVRAKLVAQIAIFLFLIASQVAGRPQFRAQPPLGFRSVVHHLNDAGMLAGQRVLVVSDEEGEGACVAEAAVLGLDNRPVILRSSKILGSDDWMGRAFEPRYPSAEAMLADLEAMHVKYVILDRSHAAQLTPAWLQAQAAMTAFPSRTELVMTREVDARDRPARPLELYRVLTQTSAPAKAPDFKPSPTPDAWFE